MWRVALLALHACASSSSSSSSSSSTADNALRVRVEGGCYREVEADEFGAPGCFQPPNAPSCGGNTSDTLPDFVVEVQFALHNSGPADYNAGPLNASTYHSCTEEQYFGQPVTYALYADTSSVELTPPATDAVCILDDCSDYTHNTHVACNASQGIRAHCDAAISHDPYRLPCHWLALNGTARAHVTAGQRVTLEVTVGGATAHKALVLRKCHKPANTAVALWVVASALFCCFLSAVAAVISYTGARRAASRDY